jgi:hypothetical protein
VLVAVAIGGPAACVIHCLRLDAMTHQRVFAGHHSQHDAHSAHGVMLSHDSGAAGDDHPTRSADDAPSALTIGVVLALALLPSLIMIALPPPPRLLPLRNISPIPPRAPPRALLAH